MSRWLHYSALSEKARDEAKMRRIIAERDLIRDAAYLWPGAVSVCGASLRGIDHLDTVVFMNARIRELRDECRRLRKVAATHSTDNAVLRDRIRNGIMTLSGLTP